MRVSVGARLRALVMLAMVLGLVLIASSAVIAAELEGGTVVLIDGMDDTTATVWSFIRGKLVQIFAAVLMLAGAGRAGSGHMGQGAGIFGTGVVVPFIPGIAATGTTATQSATLASLSQHIVASWWPGVHDPVLVLALVLGGVLFSARRRPKEVMHS